MGVGDDIADDQHADEAGWRPGWPELVIHVGVADEQGSDARKRLEPTQKPKGSNCSCLKLLGNRAGESRTGLGLMISTVAIAFL